MADLGFGPEVSVGDDAIRWANGTADAVVTAGDFLATAVAGERAVRLAPGQVQAAGITSPGYGERTAETTLAVPHTGSMTFQGKLICRELEWLDSTVAPGGESRFVVLDAGDYAAWPMLPPVLGDVAGFLRDAGAKLHVPLWFAGVHQTTNEVQLNDLRYWIGKGEPAGFPTRKVQVPAQNEQWATFSAYGYPALQVWFSRPGRVRIRGLLRKISGSPIGNSFVGAVIPAPFRPSLRTLLMHVMSAGQPPREITIDPANGAITFSSVGSTIPIGTSIVIDHEYDLT